MEFRKPVMASLALLGLAWTFSPSQAATDEECSMMWTQADANKDGQLSGEEADRYGAWLRIANKSVPEDGVITQAMFLQECKADVFRTAAVEEGAPFKGANSFTENQAKDRVLAAGFTGVSALKQDADGIWRGTAMRNGQSVPIAVDYKGNVVSS